MTAVLQQLLFLSRRAEAGDRQKQVLSAAAIVRGSMTPPEINSGNRRQAGRIVSRFCLRFAKGGCRFLLTLHAEGRTNQLASFGTPLCIEVDDVFFSPADLRSQRNFVLKQFYAVSIKN